MLPLPRTGWEAPTSIAEAVRLSQEPGARLIAGGTDLVPSMKHRIFTPSLLVSTRRIGDLHGVESRGDRMSIGASVTLRELVRNPTVRSWAPALAHAASTVATPTIQAMGTLGGNVLLDTRCLYYNQPEGWRAALGGCLKCVGDTCHVAPKGKGCYAAHSADTVPVLMLLGAVLVVADSQGGREVPIGELYGDDGLRPHALPSGTLLVRIELPRPPGPVVHRKLRLRQAIDYAQLLTAVSHSNAGWSAVVSAVGPGPIRVSAATAAELPDVAFRAVQPLATHLSAATWRKKMVRVEVRRALEDLAHSG